MQYDKLMALVSSDKPDVSNLFVNIPNYKLFRKDKQSKRGGGVYIYICNEIHSMKTRTILYEQLVSMNDRTHNDFELLWVELKFDSIKMLIYKPPNCSFDTNHVLCKTIC